MEALAILHWSPSQQPSGNSGSMVSKEQARLSGAQDCVAYVDDVAVLMLIAEEDTVVVKKTWLITVD